MSLTLVLMVSLLPAFSWAAPPPPPPPPSSVNQQRLQAARSETPPEPDPIAPAEQPLRLKEPALGHVASAFVEAGGAFLVATSVGFVGFITGALVCADDNGEGFEELGCALGWGLIAYGVAVPISVWAIGEALRWDGSFWLTLAGTIVGGALFGALTAGPGLIFGAPVGGAIGFQLSADPYSAASAFNAQPATFVPVVSFQF